jgi:CheY-like chemotaxis protein
MAISNALVVDDSRLARLTLTRLLEKRQIQVEKATCAREALEALKTSKPDVILMDVTMPDIDGLEATRMITSNPETSSIPVVMCTAEDSEDARSKAQQCGATAFLTKPAGDENLDRVLKEIAERLEAATTAADAVLAGTGLEELQEGGESVDSATLRVSADLVGDLTERVRAAVDAAFDARTKTFEDTVLAAAKEQARTAASVMVEDVASRVASEAASLNVPEQPSRRELGELIRDEMATILDDEALNQRIRGLAANAAIAAASETAEQAVPGLAQAAAKACAHEVAEQTARAVAKEVAQKETQEAVYQIDVEGLSAAAAKAATTARIALVVAVIALAGAAAAFLL